MPTEPLKLYSFPEHGLIHKGDQIWDHHQKKWVPCKYIPGLRGSAHVENRKPVRRPYKP